jgi:hypothetical protein
MSTILIILACGVAFALGHGVGESKGYWKAFYQFRGE